MWSSLAARSRKSEYAPAGMSILLQGECHCCHTHAGLPRCGCNRIVIPTEAYSAVEGPNWPTTQDKVILRVPYVILKLR